MEENNFFGFVSKIGSLISNNKPKETKKIKPAEKKYNIKISTDMEDEKEIDNIDNPDEDEDEEEEEEDDEDTKEPEEKKKKKEGKEQIEKEEKNKIQNLVLDILKDNDNKDKEDNTQNDIDEEKIDDDNENNINSDENINNINNDNKNFNKSEYPQILNNAFPVSNDNNKINGAFFYDETSSCHIMLKKGNDININDYTIFPILFMEKQKNLFYKMGMINTPSYEQKNYILFFDEHYLYFAKDEIILEEMDENMRRITKIVSLFDIKDFTNDHNNEQFIIKLTIKKEMKDEKIISFYIDQKYFAGFIKNFNLKLSIYGIDFFTDKNNSI
jgi:hypothetical protein